jgi:hypothetical protein
MNVHGGTAVYNKVRYTEHEANADGFLDVDHARENPSGALRVGFFGDSYVEAMQVPLDQAFFRLLPPEIDGRPLEAFAFGRSGWGTVHSLLVWRLFGPRYGLDVVCYVFVENDPGDSSFVLEQYWKRFNSPMPYADLSDQPPGFTLQWLTPPGNQSGAFKLVKFVQAHSRLVQVTVNRLTLLRMGGARITPDARAANMSGQAGAVPDSNDAPSTWPPEILTSVKELNVRLLRTWRDEVAAQGERFFVLYVPRAQAQLTGEMKLEDTWRPWLGEVTAELGIPLLDPSAALAARLAAGDAVFDDHFSPAGHQVIAAEVARYLEGLERPAADGREPSGS